MYRGSAFQRGSLRTSGVVCVQAGESAYQQGRLPTRGESVCKQGSLRTGEEVCVQAVESAHKWGRTVVQVGKSAHKLVSQRIQAG